MHTILYLLSHQWSLYSLVLSFLKEQLYVLSSVQAMTPHKVRPPSPNFLGLETFSHSGSVRFEKRVRFCDFSVSRPSTIQAASTMTIQWLLKLPARWTLISWLKLLITFNRILNPTNMWPSKNKLSTAPEDVMMKALLMKLELGNHKLKWIHPWWDKKQKTSIETVYSKHFRCFDVHLYWSIVAWKQEFCAVSCWKFRENQRKCQNLC